jgi:hypothetical protein
MKTLKTLLEEDHSKKTKAELIEMLQSIQNVITPSEYEKISGVDPKELDNLLKKEIVGIVDKIKAAYNENWENKIASASSEVLGKLFDLAENDEDLFSTADASDADFAAELGSIDFAKIIGGPLDACVKAQNNASISTVSFINEVGFVGAGPNKELRMVDFSYKKTVPDTSEGAAEGATTEKNVELTVPFVSILNIPSLRIETCEVDFNVKLNSTYTKDTSSEFGIDAGVSGGWGPVKFNVDVSYKRTSSTGIKVEKEYSLGVKVKATNDEMPAGLEKVLGIMSQ